MPNLVPLDQMNPDPTAIADPILREDAIVSSTLNFEEVDKAPEDTLNRILWRAMKRHCHTLPGMGRVDGRDLD